MTLCMATNERMDTILKVASTVQAATAMNVLVEYSKEAYLNAQVSMWLLIAL